MFPKLAYPVSHPQILIVTLKVARSTLSLENNINWLTGLGFFFFFYTPNCMISKCSKNQSQSKFPLCTPHHRHAHTHELLNPGNQMRERGVGGARLPLLHIVYIYILSSHCKHEVHCQKCLGQSLYSALNSNFCLPRL